MLVCGIVSSLAGGDGQLLPVHGSLLNSWVVSNCYLVPVCGTYTVVSSLADGCGQLLPVYGSQSPQQLVIFSTENAGVGVPVVTFLWRSRLQLLWWSTAVTRLWRAVVWLQLQPALTYL